MEGSSMGDTIDIENLPEEVRSVIEMASQSLQPITPAEGVEQFLEWKSTDIVSQTVGEYERKLGYLKQFCEMKSIENLNEFDGRTLNEYRRWRRLESADRSEPLAPKTMRDELYLLNNFVGFLEDIEGVADGLSKKIDIPDLDDGEGVRDINLDADRVEAILEYLSKFHYASREHVTWLFFAQLGRRPGGLYALDKVDIYLDCEDPYIEFNHRPPETTLKNKSKSEDEIAIFEPLVTVLNDYIEKNRIEVTTDNGRKPLLTSQEGRLSKTSMRRYIYAYSRPCAIGKDCPHDRDPDSCEAAQPGDSGSKCPSSRPPYALRHGYITHHVNEGLPMELLSDRCDTSKKMIKKHYDERDETDKRELRAEILEEMHEDSTGGGYQ